MRGAAWGCRVDAGAGGGAGVTVRAPDGYAFADLRLESSGGGGAVLYVGGMGQTRPITDPAQILMPAGPESPPLGLRGELPFSGGGGQTWCPGVLRSLSLSSPGASFPVYVQLQAELIPLSEVYR